MTVTFHLKVWLPGMWSCSFFTHWIVHWQGTEDWCKKTNHLFFPPSCLFSQPQYGLLTFAIYISPNSVILHRLYVYRFVPPSRLALQRRELWSHPVAPQKYSCARCVADAVLSSASMLSSCQIGSRLRPWIQHAALHVLLEMGGEANE